MGDHGIDLSDLDLDSLSITTTRDSAGLPESGASNACACCSCCASCSCCCCAGELPVEQ